MAIDEALFGWLWRRLRPKPQTVLPAEAVSLESRERGLSLLASMLAGYPVSVVPSATLDARFMVVPRVMSAGPTVADNEALFRVRVSMDAEARRQGWRLPRGATLLQREIAVILVGARVEEGLVSELPGFAPELQRCREILLATRPSVAGLSPMKGAVEALIQFRLGRRVQLDTIVDRRARAWVERALAEEPRPETLAPSSQSLVESLGLDTCDLPPLWGLIPSQWEPEKEDDHAPDPRRNSSRAGSPHAIKTKAHVQRIERLEPSLGENPVTHSFEKVHTIEEYQGGRRQTDGADEMSQHARALEEIELGHTVRSSEASAAFATTDAALSADIENTGVRNAEATLRYDEWDESRRGYRRGWCSLVESDAPDSVGAAAGRRWEQDLARARRGEIARLRAMFARIESERRWRGRQLEGPEVDLDAIIDRYAALRSGHTPPVALYSDRRRASPSLSVTFLLDGSASTDAWVANRRVMDVAKEAIVVVARALENVEFALSVAAFSSATRHACRYSTIKEFDAPWNSMAGKLCSLSPDGYTRIGPAVRHATTKLAARSSKRKVLLLLSDGKPTDYDAYEGRYGIADVRQALRESRAVGVETFALAVESRARAHLAQMFGAGRYATITKPDALAGAVGALLAQLLR